MRGLGWGPIGMLVVAGWILNTIGEGAFKVLLHLVMGIVLLRKVVALIARFGWLKPQGSSAANDATESKRQRSESRRGASVAELIRAVQGRDADRIEFLVLQRTSARMSQGVFQGRPVSRMPVEKPRRWGIELQRSSSKSGRETAPRRASQGHEAGVSEESAKHRPPQCSALR